MQYINYPLSRLRFISFYVVLMIIGCISDTMSDQAEASVSILTILMSCIIMAWMCRGRAIDAGKDAKMFTILGAIPVVSFFSMIYLLLQPGLKEAKTDPERTKKLKMRYEKENEAEVQRIKKERKETGKVEWDSLSDKMKERLTLRQKGFSAFAIICVLGFIAPPLAAVIATIFFVNWVYNVVCHVTARDEQVLTVEERINDPKQRAAIGKGLLFGIKVFTGVGPALIGMKLLAGKEVHPVALAGSILNIDDTEEIGDATETIATPNEEMTNTNDGNLPSLLDKDYSNGITQVDDVIIDENKGFIYENGNMIGRIEHFDNGDTIIHGMNQNEKIFIDHFGNVTDSEGQKLCKIEQHGNTRIISDDHGNTLSFIRDQFGHVKEEKQIKTLA